MTPNITATSSASHHSAPTHPQTKTGPAEERGGHAQEQVSAGVEGSIRTPSPPAAATSTTTPSTTATPTAHDLTAAVEELNQHFQDLPNTHLQFSMDDQSGEMVVKVMDVEKEEVIRQIPPEEVLALAAFLKEQTEKEAQRMNLTASGASGFAKGSTTPEGLLLHAKA